MYSEDFDSEDETSPHSVADAQILATERAARKRLEAELEASEQQYRTLVAQLENYAIYSVNLEGRATSWNEGVERVLGWTRDEFLGLPAERLFAPEDVKLGEHRSELQRAAEHGIAANDRWLQRKDGTPFYAMGLTSRLVDSAGHVIGFSKVLRDRTAWRLAQDERDKLFESEHKAREDAEQANRLKDEFLATLSHELRSPLNAIVGWVHILRRNAERDSELARGLETIERNARSQTQIINDLLDMSRIMTGKVHLNIRGLSLHRAIQAAVDAVRPAADTKNIQLSMTLDPSVDRVRGDPNRLHQVIWNLLTNALKFTPNGGSIHVGLERAGPNVEISIQDSGVGIPVGFLPHVFDRFRQADASTTRPYGGLGLGLSIVKNLVELHGGTVRAKSAGEGQGATFVIGLPMSPAPLERREDLQPGTVRSADADRTMPMLTGISVLVVDDEADSLVFAGRLLEERNARVLLAVDGPQAIETLRTGEVDILVSDIGMANEDGYQLIARVRALEDKRIARIPAIAVTAYARAEDRQRMLLAGFQMHISKPIEPQELIAGIASLAGVIAQRGDGNST